MARGPFTDFVVGQNDELVINAADHTWLTVGTFSVRVAHSEDGGLNVIVYPLGAEDGEDVIDSMNIDPIKE